MGRGWRLLTLKLNKGWESLTGDPLVIDDRSGAASAALAPGAQVAGRYRLEELLGRGGMGRVWRATDTLEHREIAFKQMDAAALKEKAGAQDTAGDALTVLFKREFYT